MIRVYKGPLGYYVENTDRKVLEISPDKGTVEDMIASSQKCPLHVRLALDGAEVAFDKTKPMVLTDYTGRKLSVKFDDKILEVEDLAEPGVVLEQFDVGTENIFWYIVAGVPDK